MKKLIYILALFTVAACAGKNDLGPGKTGQQFTIEGHSYNEVWNASLDAVRNARGAQSLEVDRHPSIDEKDKGKGVIKASTSLGLWSWGEVIGVFIDPAKDAKKYTINVESRTTYAPSGITSNNWEDEIIAGIKHNLSAKH